MSGKQRRDLCACGREKTARAPRCKICSLALVRQCPRPISPRAGKPNPDSAARALAAAQAIVGACADPLAVYWQRAIRQTNAACAADLEVSERWIRRHRPARTRSQAPRPPAPKPSAAERFALAIERDPRPDEDKIDVRLTLIKMIERRVRWRRAKEAR